MKKLAALLLLLSLTSPAPATDATGFITIATIPLGEAPFEIREAWIGLTLPYVGRKTCTAKGIITGRTFSKERPGYVVPQVEALRILQAQNPKAAQWWYDRGFPKRDYSSDADEGFCFSFDDQLS